MGQVTRRAAGAAGCAAALLWFAGLAYAGPLSAAKPAGLSRGGSGMRAQGPAAADPRCWRAAATVTAGPTPFADATDPKTDRIYVANAGTASKYQGTVSVINGRTNRVIKTIRVGREADSVAVNSATNRIFVTNDISGTVSVISGRTLRVIATVRVGANPSDVAVNARTGAAYVTNAVNGTVSVIRGPRYRVTATIGSGSGPSDIAVNPSTGLLYVADRAGNDDNTIAVIDPRVKTIIASIPLPGTGDAIAADRTTNRIYVTSDIGTSLWVISGQSNSVTGTIAVGTSPSGVAVLPRTRTVVVANSGAISDTHGTMSVINARAGTVTSTLRAGRHPDDIALNWKTRRVYVVNSGFLGHRRSGTVTVFAPCRA